MVFTLDLSDEGNVTDEGNITDEGIDKKNIINKTEPPKESIIQKPKINSLSSLEDVHISQNNQNTFHNNFYQDTFYNKNNLNYNNNNNKIKENDNNNNTNDNNNNNVFEEYMKAEIITLSSENTLKSQNSNHLINGSFSHYLIPDQNNEEDNNYYNSNNNKNIENFFSNFNESNNDSFSTSKFNNQSNNQSIFSQPYKKNSHGYCNINNRSPEKKQIIDDNFNQLNKRKELKEKQNKKDIDRINTNNNNNSSINKGFESNIMNALSNDKSNKRTYNYINNSNLKNLINSINGDNPDEILDNNLPSEENIFPLSPQNKFNDNIINDNFSPTRKNTPAFIEGNDNNPVFTVNSYRIDSENKNNNIDSNDISKKKKLLRNFKINSQIDENEFSDVDFLE